MESWLPFKSIGILYFTSLDLGVQPPLMNISMSCCYIPIFFIYQGNLLQYAYSDIYTSYVLRFPMFLGMSEETVKFIIKKTML